MTRAEVINAFREVASEEFIHIPNEEDIKYEFSEKFNKKMKKLLRKAEHKDIHRSSKISKRIIAVAAAIVIILAGLMSVSAIREPIVKYVIELFDNSMDFNFEGDTSKIIEYEYGFSEIPKGFKLVNKTSDEGVVYSEYENVETGEIIILDQSITDGSWRSVDTEHGTITTEIIDNTEVYIYENENEDYIHANWIKETYSFLLVYYGDIEKDDFIELIKLIK
jgi:hypothetical protein